jgi:hypothetical protein
LNPRIFPAVVSATVAASEAMTVLRPQPVAADFVFGGASGVGCANAVAGMIAEPANPAPKVAMAPIKERRSFNTDPESQFNFDVIPVAMSECPTTRSSVRLRGTKSIVVHAPSHFSITETAYLSIKIVGDSYRSCTTGRQLALRLAQSR